MNTLSAKFRALIQGTLMDDGTSIDKKLANIDEDPELVWATGDGAGEIDAVFVAEGTIDAGYSETFDLFDGSLLDPLRNALVFASVKFLYVRNVSSEAVGLLVGCSPTTALLEMLGAEDAGRIVKADDMIIRTCWSSGEAITSGANDFTIGHDGSTSLAVDYQVIMLGVKA